MDSFASEFRIVFILDSKIRDREKNLTFGRVSEDVSSMFDDRFDIFLEDISNCAFHEPECCK